MTTEVVVALIAGAVALASATGTIWNARAIKQLELNNEQRKASEQREREVSKYREPLIRAANHLQSRLFNILRKEFIPVFYINGNDREKAYVENSTVFLIAQYFCWSELVYREIQYIDLGNNQKTLELLSIQYNIARAWATGTGCTAASHPPNRLTGHEQCPYCFLGSATAVRFADRCFLLWCRHQTRDYAANDVTIPIEGGTILVSGSRLLFVNEDQDNADEEFKDIYAMEFVVRELQFTKS